MSETALPNNENNHPKPEKARGGVGKILSFPDKVGSHVFHNVIGIGKFGKLEEILGNPSGEVIKNVKNRLRFKDQNGVTSDRLHIFQNEILMFLKKSLPFFSGSTDFASMGFV